MSRVPKLRFKEFSGEWEEKKLGNICTFFSGGTPTSSNKSYYDGNIPFIGSGKIGADSVDQYITEEALKNSSAKLVKKGDLLYALYGATSGEVAISKIDGAINQAVLCIRSQEEIYFLLQWLLLNKTNILSTYLQGGQGNLSAQIIKSLMLRLPVKQEQQKIASFLSAVDTKIDQLTRKKELFEQYKKAVMQKIFSQELRFKADDGSEFPEWEEKELGQLCKVRTGKLDANAMVSNGQYRFYTCAKEYYQIDEYAFDTDALIISGNGANVGYIHHYKGKFNAYQRTYVLDKFENNIVFIKYFLDKFLYGRIFTEKKEGNTPYIVLSTLTEMPINLPTYAEQTKIANFLSAIDTKINLVAKQLDEAKNFKKGLLQQMFV